jgi:hypothetical protein
MKANSVFNIDSFIIGIIHPGIIISSSLPAVCVGSNIPVTYMYLKFSEPLPSTYMY